MLGGGVVPGESPSLDCFQAAGRARPRGKAPVISLDPQEGLTLHPAAFCTATVPAKPPAPAPLPTSPAVPCAGSLTLIGGDPGVGKSTLLLQLAGILAAIPVEDTYEEAGHSTQIRQTQTVLYVSAEESVEQVSGAHFRAHVSEYVHKHTPVTA